MILLWLVVQLEFQKSSIYLKTTSVEEILTDLSILMKLLLMVLLYKLLLFLVLEVKKSKIFYFLMLFHFLLVLKLLEESWQLLLKEIPVFLLKNNKSSQLTKITNQVS